MGVKSESGLALRRPEKVWENKIFRPIIEPMRSPQSEEKYSESAP
jgi:hypothetical protein